MICMLSFGLALQVLAVHAAGVVRSLAVTTPPAPAVAVIVKFAAKVALGFASAPAAKAQGLVAAPPEQVTFDQPTKWKPTFGVAAIDMASPIPEWHVLDEQSDGVVVSLAVTLPPVPAAAVMVTVKCAVTFWATVASSVHGLVVPVQVLVPTAPDQPVKVLPPVWAAVTVTVAPTSPGSLIVHVAAAGQEGGVPVTSVIATVPSPDAVAVIAGSPIGRASGLTAATRARLCCAPSPLVGATTVEATCAPWLD